MPKDELRELSEEEAKFKLYWSDVIKHIKRDLAYIWTDEVKRDFEGIRKEAGKITFILGKLHVHYKTDNKKYYKEISDVRNLLRHISKIKPKVEWIKQVRMDLQEIILNIEREKAESLGEEEITRRGFFKKGARVAAGIAALGGASAAFIYQYLIHEASKLPVNNKDGLAILISRPDNPIEILGVHFVNGYTARIELAFGFRAKYIINNATREDLHGLVYDPSIQNIAILGHGRWESWEASNGLITTSNLADWYNDKKSNKKGWLLKHTCGSGAEESGFGVNFRYSTFKDLEKKKWEINGELPPNCRVGWNVQKGGYNVGGKYDEYINRVGVYVDRLIVLKDGKVVSLESLPIGVKEKIIKFNEYVEQLFKNPQYTQPFLFGIPFFNSEKIGRWMRITSPIDFLLDPFAGKKYEFDKSPKSKIYDLIKGRIK